MADISKISIDGGTTEYNLKDSTARSDITAINGKIGAANGIASLNGTGKVPESQLPSYVDDVVEGYLYEGDFYEDAEHQDLIPPETGKIYIDLETNKTYRWSGSLYVCTGSDLEIGETTGTAFDGGRGKAIEDKVPSSASSSNKLTSQTDVLGIVDDRLENYDLFNLFDVDHVEIGKDIHGTTNANKARYRKYCDSNTWYTAKWISELESLSISYAFSTDFSGSGLSEVATLPQSIHSKSDSEYLFLEFSKTNITKAQIEALNLIIYESIQKKLSYDYADGRVTINSIS